MVVFAEQLFNETDDRVPVGGDHFAVLWPEVARILFEIWGGALPSPNRCESRVQ